MKGLQVGAYTLETLLGEGGMAEVWLGRNPELNTRAAVKFLSAQWAGNPQISERFVLEAGRQTKLRHPHIVSAFDFVYVEGRPYLLMPYVDGESLDQVLFQLQGPVPIEHALPICDDVLGALQYAHSQNIVHRDVKPSNIMLDKDGRAFVLDFGIALGQGERRLTQAGRAVGTPHYMSPEQILGSPQIDGRSDIYSFGCVLYQMLTHAYVFDAEEAAGDVSFLVKNKHLNETPRPPRQLNPAIPEHIAAAILRCLEKEPAKRFDTCKDLLTALNDPGWANRRVTVMDPTPRPIPPPIPAAVPPPVPSVGPPPVPSVGPQQVRSAAPPPIPATIPPPIPAQSHAPTIAIPATHAPAPAPRNRWLIVAAGVTLGILLLAGGFIARQVLTSRRSIEIPGPTNSATVTPPSGPTGPTGDSSQPPPIKPSPMPPQDPPKEDPVPPKDPTPPTEPPPSVQPPVSRPADTDVTVLHPPQQKRQQTEPAAANPIPTVPGIPPGGTTPLPYTGPQSGVLVWKGHLDEGQVVEIGGLDASAGALTGNAFPGVAVKVMYRPKIVVFTELPNAANRFARLRFRSLITSQATVTLQWSVLPQ